MKQTMLGMPIGSSAASQPSAPAVTPNSPAYPASGRPPPAAGMKKTLVGMVAPNFDPSAPPHHAPAPTPASPNGPDQPTSVGLGPGAPNAAGKTIVGGHAAPPPAGPAFTSPASTSPVAADQPRSLRGGGTQIGHADPNPLRLPSNRPPAARTIIGMVAPHEAALFDDSPPPSGPEKTLLGVAHPGVAPVNPNVPKQEGRRHELPPSMSRQAPFGPPPAANPAPPPATPSAKEPGQKPKPASASVPKKEEPNLRPAGVPQRGSKAGWLLVALAAMLLVGIVAFVLVWDPPKPLEGQISVGDDGSEVLELRCEDCADGTTIELRGQKAVFQGLAAKLKLQSKLVVGLNELHVSLARPGIGRDEEVKLEVPVRYRVSTELTNLDQRVPALLVKIHTELDATCVVEGQAVKLRLGKGQHLVDISKDLVGAAAEAKPLDRAIKYSITFSDGSVETGNVRAGVKIAPLVIEAPGDTAITESEHFMLAGQTASGGAITVAGKPITVDPEGRFAQLMSVDSVGETKIYVRAAVPNMAPRLAQLRVRRVSSLKQAAIQFKADATSEYDSFAHKLEQSSGLAVALSGRVEDVRIVGHSTVLVLDVSDGCANGPCLARVVVGARKKLKRGDHLEVYGHVTRAVDGPEEGTRVPEIRADFTLK